MKYKIEFQYKTSRSSRPEDAVQDDEILFEGGQFLPIPNVEDSVTYMYGGKPKAFKVLTRHFSYLGDFCVVNIVVTDISKEEFAARLKE